MEEAHIKKSNYFNRIDPKEVLARRWTQPKLLKTTFNHSNFCELCSGIVICTGNSDQSLMCMYCQVSIHKSCLLNGGRSFSLDLEGRNDEQWICFHCIDSLENSRKSFRVQMQSAKNFQCMVASQIIIAKYWRRMRGLRKYRSVYKILLRLQGWYRLRKIRNTFLQQRLEKRRVIKVSIASAENMIICCDTYNKCASKDKILLSSYYIIVAAVDQSGCTFQQTWQNTSPVVTISANSKLLQHPSIEFNSEHWLPGVSGLDLITVSVIQKGSVKDFFLGQVCVDLSVNELWLNGGSFKEALVEKLFVIKKVGMDAQYGYPPQPQGQLNFHVHVFNGLATECGYVLGSPSEDYVRVLQKLPPASAFLFSTSAMAMASATSRRGADIVKAVSASSSKANTDESTENKQALAVVCNRDQIKLPVGKPFDEMITVISSLKKKLWMAMVDGYILIYHHCGGPLRLILSISQFEYSIQSNPKGKVFSFHKFSYPSFHFQMLDKRDFLCWNIGLVSNLRLHMNPLIGVDVRVLIVDILDVKAAYQKNAKSQLLNSQSDSPGYCSSERSSDHGHGISPPSRPFRRLMSRSYDLDSSTRPVSVRKHSQQKSVDDVAELLVDLQPAALNFSEEDTLVELRFSVKKSAATVTARSALRKSACVVASSEYPVRKLSVLNEK